MSETIKGYKIFNPDFTCKNHQFSENSEHKLDGEISICNRGFHFCLQAAHCFSYYSFNPENIVCEVEALGETQKHPEDSKICANHIKVGRRLSWEEVLRAANSGANNSGHSNSGDSNSGYRNSGAFSTDQNPKLFLFNKPCKKMTVKEWENSKAVNLMYSIDNTLWIPSSHMTDEEKAAHPKYKTTEGYLKTIPLKEAWQNAWANWSRENRKVFTDLENFDSDIFEEITGIKVK